MTPRPWARTAGLIIALSAASGCATLGAGRVDALRVMTVAARHAREVDAVWPGYRPFERGFILFDPGRGAWLTSDVPPPAPWAEVSSDEPTLRGRLYHRSSDLPGLTGGISTGHRVGEETYPAVELGGSLGDVLETLYHEAFHAWQHDNFARRGSGEFLPLAATTPEAVASIELERRILAAALAAGDAARADSLVAAFLALRRKRMAEAPDSVRAVDRMLERIEGTAHLVGHQAAAAVLGRTPESVRDVIIVWLATDLETQPGDASSRYYRWRSYGTGAAIGLLLDRLGSAWRPRAAAGVPLDSLLLLSARVAPSESLVATARGSFGYDALLDDARRGRPVATADPVAAFLAREPHRLVIEMLGDTGSKPSLSISPGAAGWTTPERALTLLPAPRRASMAHAGVTFSVRDRPLMIDGRVAETYRLVVLLPQAPLVNGAAATVMTGPVDESLRITGRAMDLVIPGSSLLGIDVEAGVVTVRVRLR